MRIYGLFVLLIGIMGCAALNQPIGEMPVSRLTCESNPEFVDGNLETESTFAVKGFVRNASLLHERFDVAFERVSDKQHQDIEGLNPVRFRIEREVLYLRMSADGIEDRQNSVRTANSGVEIPLRGASIREVKFYIRQTP